MKALISFRPGLFAWGLLVALAGAALIFSATVSQLSIFNLAITGMAALGAVLAIAALIPRRDAPADGEPALQTAQPESAASELLDGRVGEQEPFDTGGAEVDLGDR